MKRPYSPDELNRLEQLGYNTSNYKGELVEFPDPESQSSVGGSVARGLAAEAIPATAGAASFAAGAAASAPWAAAAVPVIGPFAAGIPIIAGLGASIGGSSIARAAQNAVIPQSWNEQLAIDQAEHPIAARVGGLGAMALTMRPSLGVTKDALKAASQLPASVGAWRALTPEGKAALANVGLGAGLSGATEVGRELVAGEDLSIPSILGETAIGAAFNKPTALGRTVMRLPAHPEARAITDPEAYARTLAPRGLPPQQDAHVAPFRQALATQATFNDAAVDLANQHFETVAKQNAEIERLKANQDDIARAVSAALSPETTANAPVVEAPVEQPKVAAKPALTKAEETELGQMTLNQENAPRATTPIQEEVQTAVGKMGKSGEVVTPANKAMTTELLQRKNIGVEENQTMDEKGHIFPDSPNRKAIINPVKEDITTRPHEGLHYMRLELEAEAGRGNTNAQKLLRQLDTVQEAARTAYNKQRAAAGLPPVDAHEFSVNQQGWEFVKQQLNLNKEGAGKKWWEDTKALWKTRYGSNPTEEQLRRALNFRFVNEEGMGTVGKKGPLGETGTVMPKISGTTLPTEEKRKMSSEEGFNTDAGDDVLSMSPNEQDIEVNDALPVKLSPPPEGYRRVKVVKPDGGHYEAFFNDKRFPGTKDLFHLDEDLASIAKVLPNGELTHGVLKPGEKIEELKSQTYRREQGKEEGFARQQESPEFKKWFGESKAVDTEGKPLALYHGSGETFSQFKQSKEGSMGKGIYLSSDPEFASKYSEQSQFGEKQKGSPQVYKTYVNLKNPIVVENGYINEPGRQILEKLGYSKDKAQSIVEKAFEEKGNLTGELQTKLKNAGYDGIMLKGVEGDVQEVVVFDNKQIKSATGNSGKFDSTNPDIRAQGAEEGFTDSNIPTDVDNSPQSFGFKSFRPLAAAFDRVRKVSVQHAEAANNYEARKDSYVGMGNAALSDLSKFPREEVNKVMAAHREAYRNDAEPVLEGKNDAAISKILTDYYGGIGDIRQDLGIRIEGRKAGKNPYYVPDMMNAETIDMFINHPTSPEALYAKNQWIEHVMEASNNKLSRDKVTSDVNDYIAALGGKSNNYRAIEFGAIRRAAGFGLPETLRDTDGISSLARYSRRAANDLAFFQEIQNKPEIAGPLMIKNQEGKLWPGYDNSVLPQSKEIKDMMSIITGDTTGRSLKSHPALAMATRLVNNALLGGATGVRDLASVPVNALPYIHNFTDLANAWKGLLNMRANSRAALETAARQPNIDRVAFQDVLNGPDRVLNVAGKVADGFRKYQGREFMENLSRDIVFSVGKEVARGKILQAKAGDKGAEGWLKKFGTLVEGDVTALEGEALEKALNQIGKNFTDRNQGTYGGRGLPTLAIDSQLAPFLSLQKWGIEKSNVIYKDVVKPFMTGENRLPMLTYALGTVLTGAAIQQLNKVLSGRRPQDPELKEALAKGDAASVIQELTTLMQLGSFAGIVGDGIKGASDALIRGKTPRNIISFPTATSALKTQESITDAAEAIRQGENPWDVVKALSLDLIVNNIQNARMLANHTWKGEDIERSDKFRDVRTFNELEGKPASAFTQTNPYLDLVQKKFKRTDSLAEAATLAPKLVKEAVTEAKGDRSKLKTSLASLKGNSYQTMPSPETSPTEFKKFYDFLVQTQGKEEANQRVVDFLHQRELNKIKGRMIP